MEIGGARDLDTLRIRLAACMVRRVRPEVLSQPELVNLLVDLAITLRLTMCAAGPV